MNLPMRGILVKANREMVFLPDRETQDEWESEINQRILYVVGRTRYVGVLWQR